MSTQITKFVTLSRQLSVALTFSMALPAFANVTSSGRGSIQNSVAATAAAAPSYDSKMTMLYLNTVAALKTGLDDRKFRSFYVKPDLTMGIEYHYDFVFNFGAATAQGEKRPVPDGYYQITVASFLKAADDIDRPERISANETLEERYVTRSNPMYVRIQDGKGEAEVALRFDRPELAAVDSTLYVEFVPLQMDCSRGNETVPCLTVNEDGEVDTTHSRFLAKPGYYPYLMNMDFLPYEKANSGRRIGGRRSAYTNQIMQTSLLKFTTRILAKRQRLSNRYRRRVMTPEAYADAHNLRLVAANDPAFTNGKSKWLQGNTATEVLRQVFDAPGGGPIRSTALAKQLRKVFCNYVAERLSTGPAAANGATVRSLPSAMCGNGGELEFAFRRTQHVGEVTANFAKRRASAIENYVMMNNFAVTRSHDESSSKAHAVKIWAAVVKIIDKIGFIPYEYTQSVTISNARGTNQGGISSVQTVMSMHPVVLSIPTANTQSCLEVTISPKYVSSMLIDNRPNARNNLYVCEATKTDRTVQELYMHAFTRMPDTAGADGHDRLTQTLNVNLRGDRDVSAFFWVTRKSLTAEREEPLPDWYTEQAGAYFAKTALPEAGVIATPIVEEGGVIPSYLEMALSPFYRERFNVGPR